MVDAAGPEGHHTILTTGDEHPVWGPGDAQDRFPVRHTLDLCRQVEGHLGMETKITVVVYKWG